MLQENKHLAWDSTQPLPQADRPHLSLWLLPLLCPSDQLSTASGLTVVGIALLPRSQLEVKYCQHFPTFHFCQFFIPTLAAACLSGSDYLLRSQLVLLQLLL